MLTRVLEPELMDSAEDAREYDAMNHAAVNTLFVTDLLAALSVGGWGRASASPQLIDPRVDILDLGAGTAQIPIELCRRAPSIRVVAVDAAESMLALARKNVAAAGLADRIELVLADAKNLEADVGWAPPTNEQRCEMVGDAHPAWLQSFPAVISNSIAHHLPEPRAAIAEAVRLVAPDGLLFHRDLARPHDEAQLERLVTTYAGDATPYQRKLFADSLRAALTVDEVRQLVGEFGFPFDTVRMTSDRHWTWIATKL